MLSPFLVMFYTTALEVDITLKTLWHSKIFLYYLHLWSIMKANLKISNSLKTLNIVSVVLLYWTKSLALLRKTHWAFIWDQGTLFPTQAYWEFPLQSYMFDSFFYISLFWTPVKLKSANKNPKKSIACFPHNCGCWCQGKASLSFRLKTSVDTKKGNVMRNTFTITWRWVSQSR